MSNSTKSAGRGKMILIIGIPLVLLLMVLRFLLYYFKSDGFSGLSLLLPALMMGMILFWLITSAFFAAWVYQDCKIKGDDGVLWAVVIFLATPFIGLLIYFLRRTETKRSCLSCGHRISQRARYCEECGTRIEMKEDFVTMEKQRTHHLRYLVGGIIGLLLTFACLAAFMMTAAADGTVNTTVSSDEKVWNLGSISMNANTYLGGVWKLDFKKASDGFVAQENLTIEQADTQQLYAEISCGTVPEGASLTLWLVQEEISQSIDVTELSGPLTHSLQAFENGTLHVRLEINGVEDTVSEISLK